MARRKSSTLHLQNQWTKHARVSSPRIAWLRLQKSVASFAKLSVALAVLGGLGWGAKELVTRTLIANEDLMLNEIDLSTNGYITSEHILDLCELSMGDNFLKVDLDAIDKTLTELPEVSTASVFRRWPGTLRIELVEREPVAWIACEALGVEPRDADRGMLLDSDGVIFQCDADAYPELRSLPVIAITDASRETIGPGAHIDLLAVHRAVALVGEHSAVSLKRPDLPEIDTIEVNSVDYTLKATFDIGSRIVFGFYEHKRQLGDLIALWQHSSETSQYLAHAVLIGSRNIPVEFLPVQDTAP